MHRFYLPPEQCRGPWLRLDGREAHHALHVLRLKPGDTATVLDGVGHAFLCEAGKAGKDFLELAVREKKSTAPPPCPITLLVGVPKGKTIEDIIEKSTELGAQRLVPLLTERVVTQLDAAGGAAKQEKWRQVAVEAVKQCGAAWLPDVEKPQTIAEYLKRGEPIELLLVGSLQSERRHPREWLVEFEKQQGRPPRSAGVWIGPEGDFTPAELQSIEAAGAKPITLGELTLRVETAAIYCLSFLNYELRRPGQPPDLVVAPGNTSV
ncbi:MAG TPA: RsmE family RNA methyltransferase [Candidatus Acidoferrales bacterium]|nr:RsmE family RNA methyltransferase [Candidatus Acidoferrales bacterium]